MDDRDQEQALLDNWAAVAQEVSDHAMLPIGARLVELLPGVCLVAGENIDFDDDTGRAALLAAIAEGLTPWDTARIRVELMITPAEAKALVDRLETGS
jgi:hypothetical protein